MYALMDMERPRLVERSLIDQRGGHVRRQARLVSACAAVTVATIKDLASVASNARFVLRFGGRLGCCASHQISSRETKGEPSKRFVFAFLAIAVLALGWSALAAPRPRTPLGFSYCGLMSQSADSNGDHFGTGTSTTVEIVTTDASGVTTVTNTTHASGTATDQDGNTYRLDYSNHFRISNTGPTDPVLSGVMVDSFFTAAQGERAGAVQQWLPGRRSQLTF